MTELRVTPLRECERAWINVNLATFDHDQPGSYGLRHQCAIGVRDGRIASIQPMSSITATRLPYDVIDGHNGWMTPGLIDCHSHLVFGGQRAQEFEQRLQGVPYESIAAMGGGILATVRATRVRSREQLLKAALPRLKALTSEGVTRIEIKSGYGLNLPDEIKMLETARGLEDVHPIQVSTTLLAAHALPPEFAGRPDDYINLICQQMIPEVADRKLADAVDVYCENIAFTRPQCEQVFLAAQAHNLPIKGHMEQLSFTGGASMAARMGALSCDHLEYIDEQGVADMARAGTIAVLLPGAFYFLREKQLPPINLFRQYGVPIALASDINPGTCPLASLRLMMNMGCVLFQLTPAEALAGTTREAARALGVDQDYGSITEGKVADLCLWDIDHPNELAYQLGHSPLQQRIIAGEAVND
ncbi:MAG: imidazolonepropionase [Endozoicomonas sp.]